MEENVYKAPEADLGVQPEVEIPEPIRQRIRAGYIAAVVSGVWTLGLSIFAIYGNTDNSLFGIWTLIDVVVIFALAFGIYKRSRFAASFMVAYFFLSKVLIILETGRITGGILSIIFAYYFIRATIGTFQYHAFLKLQTNNSSG